MVSIALYRGNLHRPSGAPRRWSPPPPSLTSAQFRRLLQSRSLALSLLAPSSPSTSTPLPIQEIGCSSRRSEKEEIAAADEDVNGQLDAAPQAQIPVDMEIDEDDICNGVSANPECGVVTGEGKLEPAVVECVDAATAEEVRPVKQEGLDGNSGSLVANAEEVQPVKKEDSNGNCASTVLPERNCAGSDAAEVLPDKKPEVLGSTEVLNGNEESKKELEKKLDALNHKKHNLVQMLKQILNAEEEIKRQQLQSSMIRSSMTTQTENSSDASVSKLPKRMTVDVNFGNDMPGDSEAGSNQCTPGIQMHYVSPSSATFSRSPFHSHHHPVQTPRSPASFAPGQATANLLVSNSTVSPARFATTTQAPMPPTGSAATSLSPAAAGGSSSVFRDSRPPNFT